MDIIDLFSTHRLVRSLWYVKVLCGGLCSMLKCCEHVEVLCGWLCNWPMIPTSVLGSKRVSLKSLVDSLTSGLSWVWLVVHRYTHRDRSVSGRCPVRPGSFFRQKKRREVPVPWQDRINHLSLLGGHMCRSMDILSILVWMYFCEEPWITKTVQTLW